MTNKYSLLFFLSFICLCDNIFAQSWIITGKVIDYHTHEPLIGVNVVSKIHTSQTNIDGIFSINIDSAQYVSFEYLGYRKDSIYIRNNQNIGIVHLKYDTRTLPDVIISSQLAVDRKTPIATSTVLASNIEERLGNSEFVEILKYTPGVHANKQGGGWGDSEIFMRGFDNTNIATMVNGIPVNDMENGVVYWSNWASLNDVTSFIQTQRGIGANKLSAPSIGGTINIVTKGVDSQKRTSVSYSTGNDGYHNATVSYNSGMLGNGWFLNFLGSFNCGNGYAQGMDFNVYNYYLNITKRINKEHQLTLLFFGAPQKHYMRSNALTLSEWEKVRDNYNLGNNWRKFNPDYGFGKDGKRKSVDYNSYHKPMITLSHNWEIDNKSNLSSKVYASFGRGYSLSGKANSTTYSEYDWFGSDYGALNMKFRKEDGTVDYGMIEDINMNSTNGSEMIMTKVLGWQDTYGLISTFSTRSFDKIDWHIGLDFRYYKGLHKNTISDLYGGQYYIDPSRNNVNILDNPYATEQWKQEHLRIGDVVYRDYDSNILQGGIFGQIEYSKNKFNSFVSGSLNYTSYWRYGRFYNTGLNARSESIGFINGYIKSGLNYRINNNHNIFINVGFSSKPPQFKNGAFMSVNTSNIINTLAKNEKSVTVEGGYSFFSKFVDMNLNAYYTRWMDKSMTKKGTIKEQYYINMTGVDSEHMGVELELKANPIRWLEAGAMISIGNWKWVSDNVKGYAYDIYGQAINADGVKTSPGASDHVWAKINMKDISIGGSAQTTFGVHATFLPVKGLRLGGGYTFYDRNYAYYSLSGSNLKIGQELYVAEPWQIPSHGNLELWGSYKFKVDKIKVTISGHVSNLLNTYYIEKAWNPSIVKKSAETISKDNVYFFYSVGRMWSFKLKLDI